ncbi:MAG TPA: hypothetical protein VMK83_02080 [Gaiellaceae bacterium]|nr:hypothetical protein [Gaiellaceae bacterium]
MRESTRETPRARDPARLELPLLDPQVRCHLGLAAAHPLVRRVSKADRTRPIDAVIAASLAFWRASLDGGRSVYETRGLLVV